MKALADESAQVMERNTHLMQHTPIQANEIVDANKARELLECARSSYPIPEDFPDADARNRESLVDVVGRINSRLLPLGMTIKQDKIGSKHSFAFVNKVRTFYNNRFHRQTS